MFGPLILVAAVMAQASTPKAQATTPKPAAAKSTTSATTKPAPVKSGVKLKPAPAPALTTDDERTIYSLGLSIYRSLSQFDLSPQEMEIVKEALADAAAGKPAIDLDTWGPKIQTLARARAVRVTERQKAVANAYIEKAAAEPGAIKTESGLVYKEITPGTGASPKATDTVKVNYRGTLVDGTEFDSSYKRNQPAQFALSGVIRCWTEGLQKMKVGGKAQLVCPSDLAYGDSGRPSIPGGAALIFDIELLDVVNGGS